MELHNYYIFPMDRMHIIFCSPYSDLREVEAIILLEETKRSLERADRFELEEKTNLAEMMDYGEALKSHEFVRYPLQDIISKIQQKKVINLNTLLIQTNEFYPKSIFNYKIKSVTNYRGKMTLFKEDLKDFIYRGYKIIIIEIFCLHLKKTSVILQEYF